MKNVWLIVIIASAKMCTSQEISDSIEIFYEAYTRGSIVEIKASKENLFVKDNEGEQTLILNSKNWSFLKRLTSDFNIINLSDFKPPSNMRASDRALHATLTIKTKDKAYRSQTFDHGNPPKEIKQLVDALFELANIEE